LFTSGLKLAERTPHALQYIWTHEPSPQLAAVVMTPAVEIMEDEPRSSAGKYHRDRPWSSTKFGDDIHVPEAGNWGRVTVVPLSLRPWPRLCSIQPELCAQVPLACNQHVGFQIPNPNSEIPNSLCLPVVSLVSFVVNRLEPALVWWVVGGPGMRPRRYRNLENASAHTWVAKRITLPGRPYAPANSGFLRLCLTMVLPGGGSAEAGDRRQGCPDRMDAL
jgi:hypothetical protein